MRSRMDAISGGVNDCVTAFSLAKVVSWIGLYIMCKHAMAILIILNGSPSRIVKSAMHVF